MTATKTATPSPPTIRTSWATSRRRRATPSSPLFPKEPEAGAALQLSDSYVPYPFYNVTKQRLPVASRHAPVLSYNNAFGGAHGRPHGQVLDRVIDVRDLISHDRGNALRIGEDGLLYIHNCCRAAP